MQVSQSRELVYIQSRCLFLRFSPSKRCLLMVQTDAFQAPLGRWTRAEHRPGTAVVRSRGLGYGCGSMWGQHLDLECCSSFPPQGRYWFLSPVCHPSVTLALHTITATHQLCFSVFEDIHLNIMPHFSLGYWTSTKINDTFARSLLRDGQQQTAKTLIYCALLQSANMDNISMLYHTVTKDNCSHFQGNNSYCFMNEFRRS